MLGEGALNRLGSLINGTADRQIGERRMLTGTFPYRRESVPGEVGELQLSALRGTVAMNAASNSCAPSFDAPPGDPRSAKNSALAAV